MTKRASPNAYVNASEIAPIHEEFYASNGFLIAENIVSPSEIEEIKAETLHLFKGDRGLIEGLQQAEPDDQEFDILRKYLCIHFPHKLSKNL